MPHCHSADKLLLRRQRAVALGYIQNKPRDATRIRVPYSIAGRVKSMAESLRLHDRHDAIVGHHSHYARHAAWKTCSGIGVDLCQSALKVHSAANRAKHAGALGAAPPPLCVEPVGTPPFVESMPCLPGPVSNPSSGVDCHQCLQWRALVDAQNSTIAALSAALDSLRCSISTFTLVCLV